MSDNHHQMKHNPAIILAIILAPAALTIPLARYISWPYSDDGDWAFSLILLLPVISGLAMMTYLIIDGILTKRKKDPSLPYWIIVTRAVLFSIAGAFAALALQFGACFVDSFGW